MRIPHKIFYIVDDKVETFNFYKFIQESCTCEYGSSLSEYFQVFFDKPDEACYRINGAIDINNGWIGQLVHINLKNNTIGIGNDWAINGKGYSNNLYDMKANGIIQHYYDIVKII